MQEKAFFANGFGDFRPACAAPVNRLTLAVLKIKRRFAGNPMDIEQARFNMIEQQIRTWEVLDPRVLGLLSQVRREDFVPQRYREVAFADMQIPLGHDQVMMEPKVEARLIQELDIKPTDRILEIGTGSGYLTALLAASGKEVTSVEIIPELKAQAAKTLSARGFGNVELIEGDAGRGWDKGVLYDVVAVTGSVPLLPHSYKEILALGGRLAVVVGQAPAMEAKLIRRVGEESWIEDGLFETVLPPLLNVQEQPKFVF